MARRLQINLVGADAKRAHGHQLLRRRQRLGVQLRARAQAHKVRIGNLFFQLIALQRARQRLHIGVASVLEHFYRRRVYAFEQQEFDLAFVQRRLAHDVTLPLKWDETKKGRQIQLNRRPGRQARDASTNA